MKDTNALFAEWKKKYAISLFCKDGIIDKEKFESKGNLKVLFVLKDVHVDQRGRAHHQKNGFIDMRQYVTEDGEGKTWSPLGVWTMGLLTDIDEYDYSLDANAVRKEYLPHVAFLNIKKEAGEASVSNKTIIMHAKNQGCYIREQIKDINPDLIIACGDVVYESLTIHVFSDHIQEQKLDFEGMPEKYGECVYVEVNGKYIPIVHYRHPNQSGSYAKRYQHMREIKKILKK
jgi:hypothetical protein